MHLGRRAGGGRTVCGSLSRGAAPYLLIAPFFVLFAIFGMFPLVYTLWVSLHDWDLTRPASTRTSGSRNYRTLLDDEDFWNALVNTFGDLPARDDPADPHRARPGAPAQHADAWPYASSGWACCSQRHLDCCRDHRLRPALRPRLRPDQLAARAVGLDPVDWQAGRLVVLARDRDHGRLAVDGLQHADLPRGHAGHPAGAVRGGAIDGAGGFRRSSARSRSRSLRPTSCFRGRRGDDRRPAALRRAAAVRHVAGSRERRRRPCSSRRSRSTSTSTASGRFDFGYARGDRVDAVPDWSSWSPRVNALHRPPARAVRRRDDARRPSARRRRPPSLARTLTYVVARR